MPHEVVMPQLGLSMAKGRIARWLKEPGQLVSPGDALLEVESDKATVEVEAVASGQLHITAGAGGAEVPVGTVIAYITAAGEQPGTGSVAERVTVPAAGQSLNDEAPPGAAPAGLELRRPAFTPGMRPPSSPASAPPGQGIGRGVARG